MEPYQTIEVDFDVFKALTARLKSPADNYNGVIRKMLGLKPAQAISDEGTAAWVADGVSFPHGTEFRARLRGQEYRGRVESGALVYDGQRFYTPSAPGVAIAGYAVNGWRFWECRRPGDRSWTKIDHLRRSDT